MEKNTNLEWGVFDKQESPFLILKNPKSERYLALKKSILSDETPWRYVNQTIDPRLLENKNDAVCDFVDTDEYVDFSFLAYGVLRTPCIPDNIYFPCITSERILDYIEVLDEIFKENEIHVNSILRINVNCTTFLSEKYSLPHVDHHFPHSNLLIYLTDFTEGEIKVYKNSEWNIYKPQQDDIIMFSGLHCHRPPQKIGERRICIVVTFI